jgi:hypothetical protein
MLKVFYHPNDLFCQLYKDGEFHAVAQRYADSIKGGQHISLMTCQEQVIHAVRLAIKQGKLSHEEVEFHFIKNMENGRIKESEVILSNKDGRLDHRPKGFCDWYGNMLSDILD